MGGGASTAAPRMEAVPSYLKELRRRGGSGRLPQLHSALSCIEALSQVQENRGQLTSPQLALLQEVSALLSDPATDAQARLVMLRIVLNISSDRTGLAEVTKPALGLTNRMSKMLLENDPKVQDTVLSIFKLLLAAPGVADQQCVSSAPLLGNVVAAMKTDVHRFVGAVMDILEIITKNNQTFYNYLASQQLGLLPPLVQALRGGLEDAACTARILAFLLSAATGSTMTENDKYMCSPKLGIYKAAVGFIASSQSGITSEHRAEAVRLLEELLTKSKWEQELDELGLFPALTGFVENGNLGKQIRRIIKKLSRSKNMDNRVFLASPDSGLFGVCRELLLNSSTPKDLQSWTLQVIEALLESDNVKKAICLNCLDIVHILATIVQDQIADVALPALKLLSLISSTPVGAKALLSKDMNLNICITKSIQSGVLDAKHYSLTILFNMSTIQDLIASVADPGAGLLTAAVPLVQDVNPDVSSVMLNCLLNLVGRQSARSYIGSEALGLAPRLVAILNSGSSDNKKTCLKVCLALSECQALHALLGSPSLGLISYLQSFSKAKGTKNSNVRAAIQIIANILRTSAIICEAPDSPGFCKQLVEALEGSERSPANWAEDSTESVALTCVMHFAQWPLSHEYLVGQTGFLNVASKVMKEEHLAAKKCLVAATLLIGTSEFQPHVDLLTLSKTSIKDIPPLLASEAFDRLVVLRALQDLSNNDSCNSLLLSTSNFVKSLLKIVKSGLHDLDKDKSTEVVDRSKASIEAIVHLLLSFSLQYLNSSDLQSSAICADAPILLDIIGAVRRNRHVSVTCKRAACLLASRVDSAAAVPHIGHKPGAARPFVAIIYSSPNRTPMPPPGVDALLSTLRSLEYKVLCVADGVCTLDDKSSSQAPVVDCNIDTPMETTLAQCGAAVVCLSNDLIKSPAARLSILLSSQMRESRHMSMKFVNLQSHFYLEPPSDKRLPSSVMPAWLCAAVADSKVYPMGSPQQFDAASKTIGESLDSLRDLRGAASAPALDVPVRYTKKELRGNEKRYALAWTLLSIPKHAEDTVALVALEAKLGVYCADDIMECDLDDLLSIANALKKIQRRNFIELILDAETASAEQK